MSWWDKEIDNFWGEEPGGSEVIGAVIIIGAFICGFIIKALLGLFGVNITFLMAIIISVLIAGGAIIVFAITLNFKRKK